MAELITSAAGSLPPGWVCAPLGEVTRPERPRVRPADFGHLPFVGMEHVEANTMRLLGTVSAARMKSQAVHFFPGDVLYGRLRPYLNKVFRPDFEGLCSAEFIVFPVSPEIAGGYLQYLLNSNAFVSFASHLNEGDRPRVDFSQLSAYPVPLAPLPEQRRIVAEVEKQLTRLEAAVAALKRVQAKLKRYRASLLKAACEGRLVPTEADLARVEGRSYETAHELLDRILQDRRARWDAEHPGAVAWQGRAPIRNSKARYRAPASPGERRLATLPPGWCWTNVGQIADVGTGATPRRSDPSYYEGGTIPWVTSGAVNDRFIRNASEYVTEKALRETNLSLYLPGTLLLAMYGEGRTRGKCAELMIEATTNQAIAAIVLSGQAKATKAYLKTFLEMNYFETRRRSAGGVQPNLNLDLVRRLPAPFPPLSEQRRITDEVERQLLLVDRIQALIDASARRGGRLRQGLLKRAFEGRLVSQNPADEPASKLLNRIRASREALEEEPRAVRFKRRRGLMETIS